MPPRCFLAVTLEPSSVLLLSGAKTAFLNQAPQWAREKWVRPDLLHMTLKFIGPLPDEGIDDVIAELAAESARHEPFDLVFAGVRAKPAPGRARMVWATLAGDLRSASRLARSLSLVLGRSFGVPEPARHFAAHVTLARARAARPVPLAALSVAEAAITAGKETDRTVSVRYVTLFASTLGPAGPVHDAVGRLTLGG